MEEGEEEAYHGFKRRWIADAENHRKREVVKEDEIHPRVRAVQLSTIEKRELRKRGLYFYDIKILKCP